MPFASLCFNPALCKKQTRRFWPLFGLYALLMTFFIPGMILLQRGQWGKDAPPIREYLSGQLLNLASDNAPWIAAIYAIFVAMALWSYLYNNRSVSMLHALPLSRSGLFFTNYITGLLFAIVPNLVVTLLAIPASLLVGALPLQSLLTWLLVQTLLYLFFFSFATLLAFVTGHLLALPALYVIFNALAGGVYLLISGIFTGFVYGFAGRFSEGFLSVFYWLTPLWNMVRRVSTSQVVVGDPTSDLPHYISHFSGLSVILIYAALGLVMVAFAYLLYRRRKLELCGEVVAVRFLRPIFKYSVAVCAGLALGLLTTMFFSDMSYSMSSPSIFMLLLFTLFWAAVGYFAAEMLLRKSFRVFHKTLPGLLVLLLLLAALLLSIEFDLGGYERRIPAQDQIVEVSQVGERMNNQDPAAIAAALDLHKSLVDDKAKIEELQRQSENYRSSEDQNPDDLASTDFSYVTLEYRLTNGEYFRRSYQIPVHSLLLVDAASPAARYQAILNQPDWVLSDFFPAVLKDSELSLIEVQTFDQNSAVNGDTSQASRDTDARQIPLVGEEAQVLLRAVREDIAAGRLCQSFLDWQDEELSRTNYANVIYFTFRGAYNDKETPSAAGRWDVEPVFDLSGYPTGRQTTGYTVEFRLQSTATSTLAVLRQYGLIPGKTLLTDSEAYPDRGVGYSRGRGSSLSTPDVAPNGARTQTYPTDAAIEQEIAADLSVDTLP